MIRRRQAPANQDESSSDEEDAFSAMSRKTKAVGKKADVLEQKTPLSGEASSDSKRDSGLPVANRSSMKRHHGTSYRRKVKMDALFQGLEADKDTAATGNYKRTKDFVPEKKGSFVEPGEEHLTTNVFVGNLDPTITEEEVTELFRQFGETVYRILFVHADGGIFDFILTRKS